MSQVGDVIKYPDVCNFWSLGDFYYIHASVVAVRIKDLKFAVTASFLFTFTPYTVTSMSRCTDDMVHFAPRMADRDLPKIITFACSNLCA